ncbi:unnamed protein product [Prorocentrum cordatum]|uniref:Uncharacterized protein n=1 Tax=Prorocentrum cordatum TaxID=2364126 RepID=A0ABN9X8Z1_9DINO|nr:unnamed protein product [Polarella glacialis]
MPSHGAQAMHPMPAVAPRVARRLRPRARRADERSACAATDASDSSGDSVDTPMGLVDAFSRGSKNHHKGQCTPCRSNGSGAPCPRGAMCDCCHYYHGPEKFLAMKQFAAKPRQQHSTRADLDNGWPTTPVVCAAPRPTQQYEKVCATGGPVTFLPGVSAQSAT